MRDVAPWSDEAKSLKPGIYRHFKGDEYRVIKVARHSETVEELVVYESLEYPDRVWVRPVKMFAENVQRDGYDGPRFTYLREDQTRT